jgi:1,4-alpha-glucan branching enzyme
MPKTDMKPEETGLELQNWMEKFSAGEQTRAGAYLGAHLTVRGTVFRVWAPAAERVDLVGDFNGWTPGEHPMTPLADGIWELEVPGLRVGDRYKYAISAKDGQILWKADPYGTWAELRPGSASRICDLSGFAWSDANWLRYRRKCKVYDSPLNIYEVHAGSWRRGENGEFLTYRQLAEQLIPYVLDMGFTHVELMPLTEHPLDDSWGYQCTGYFAATARYGEPHDLMYFVNACHEAGLGVIMDWAPAHFPKDPQGLVEFDGSRCYEHADPLMGEHPSWGTRIFDYAKGQVRSFLISSALFWLEIYHMDGLRVDAVASMLYLDYDRQPHQWRPNRFGGKENLDAISFMQRLNEAAFAFDDSVLMIAEESTAWPAVTGPTYLGGLGYNLKWNMGWMNDVLRYVKTDPYFRAGCHRDLTFSLLYAFTENFLLPLSHDEVVHMKGSLYGKMPGDRQQKLAGVRVFWAYMLAHPGKKLLFMGAELGQEAEWNFTSQLSWGALEDPETAALHRFFRSMNLFYVNQPPLWEIDFKESGFRWICPDESARNIIGFRRLDREGNELMVVCNFSGAVSEGFRLGVPEPGVYRVLLSTDETCFGGSGAMRAGVELKSKKIPHHGEKQSILFNLPPLSAIFLQKNRNLPPLKQKRRKKEEGRTAI